MPSPTDIAVGVVIGRSSEFFDFFVYAIASVLVFPRVMFPFAEPLDGDALVLRDLRARLRRAAVRHADLHARSTAAGGGASS